MKSKSKKKTSNSLVTKKLENVSKLIFRNYYNQITELIGSSPGVYALYDENELYYVGKSTDLKKRVKHHLRDRHFASWTHFSLYLIRKEDHIHEIESLLIRITNPKGNKLVPKSNKGSTLLKYLKAMIKQKQKEELDSMFGDVSRIKSKKKKTKEKKSLDGLATKNTALYRTYKDKEYKAILTSDGKIKLKNKYYNSPTAAAKSIVKRAINGWTWWYVKDMNGDWVKLDNLRKK